MKARIPGYFDADMAALDALTACHLVTQKAVRELAHAVAAQHGIQLAKPQPDKPKRHGRHRYTRITRHGAGNVTAEVANEETRQTRRYHIVRADDGGLEVEEE